MSILPLKMHGAGWVKKKYIVFKLDNFEVLTF